MKTRIIAIAILAAPLAASGGCKELGAAIDAAEKDMGVLAAKIYVDNNATREIARRQAMANDLAAIQANLSLMERLKCAPPADPVSGDGGAYVSAASNCEGASGESRARACDRSTWQRSR